MFHGSTEICFKTHVLPKMSLMQIPNKPCQWYGLWMRIKGSHSYMTMCEVAQTIDLGQ